MPRVAQPGGGGEQRRPRGPGHGARPDAARAPRPRARRARRRTRPCARWRRWPRRQAEREVRVAQVQRRVRPDPPPPQDQKERPRVHGGPGAVGLADHERQQGQREPLDRARATVGAAPRTDTRYTAMPARTTRLRSARTRRSCRPGRSPSASATNRALSRSAAIGTAKSQSPVCQPQKRTPAPISPRRAAHSAARSAAIRSIATGVKPHAGRRRRRWQPLAAAAHEQRERGNPTRGEVADERLPRLVPLEEHDQTPAERVRAREHEPMQRRERLVPADADSGQHLEQLIDLGEPAADGQRVGARARRTGDRGATPRCPARRRGRPRRRPRPRTARPGRARRTCRGPGRGARRTRPGARGPPGGRRGPSSASGFAATGRRGDSRGARRTPRSPRPRRPARLRPAGTFGSRPAGWGARG